MKDKCELCGIETNLTLHHLRPQVTCRNKYKSMKNEESNHIMICNECHCQIHALYDNNYLRDNLDTKEKLQNDEKLLKFITWRQKHPDFKGSSKMSNDRKIIEMEK